MTTEPKQPTVRVDDDRVTVWDPIERSSISFDTTRVPTLEETSTEPFYFPVDVAYQFETAAIEFDTQREVHVWTSGCEFVAESTNGEQVSLPVETYLVDVSGPIKCYCLVESALEIRREDGRTVVDLGATTSVRIGVRSLHNRPTGTITVDDDPESLLAALPYLADSLYTHSPERSFPTLRGHPPLIERGRRLAIPSGLEAPQSGIRLQLPPTRRYAYPAAPLAFYLAADVVVGERPQLHVGDRTVPLDRAGSGYDAAVAQLLRHVFVLDCITRTEGYYRVPLAERAAFEQRLPTHPDGPDELDFGCLYDAPLDRRVARYLDVPFEVTDAVAPRWRVTADVPPDPASDACLPYLVDDLAIVRCPVPERVEAPRMAAEADHERFRGQAVATTDSTFVALPDADSLEHVYVGDEIPIRASSTTADAFHRRLDRRSNRTDDITVTVVVNDPDEMCSDREVHESYRSLEADGVTVRVIENVPVLRMETLLCEAVDFFHYIGHVTDRGISCPNGFFDTTAHDGYGVDAFLLNGCESYSQGHGLVDGGCVGGVATTTVVHDAPAAEIGAAFGQLLSLGFPTRAAMTIAARVNPTGRQYVVVGDGTFRLAERENGTPFVCRLEALGDDRFELTIETYPTDDLDIGTLFTPYLPSVDHRYLSSGVVDTFTVSTDELEVFFTDTSFPVEYDGELVLSDALYDRL